MICSSAPQLASGCQDTCKWSSEAVLISSAQTDQPISTAHPLRLVLRSLPRIWELRFLLPRRRVCLAVQRSAARSNAPSQACAVSCSFVQFQHAQSPGMSWRGLTTESSVWVACFSFLAGGVPPSRAVKGGPLSLACRTSICSMPSFNLLSVNERRRRRKFRLLGTILLGLAATLSRRQPALGCLQLQRLQ